MPSHLARTHPRYPRDHFDDTQDRVPLRNPLRHPDIARLCEWNLKSPRRRRIHREIGVLTIYFAGRATVRLPSNSSPSRRCIVNTVTIHRFLLPRQNSTLVSNDNDVVEANRSSIPPASFLQSALRCRPPMEFLEHYMFFYALSVTTWTTMWCIDLYEIKSEFQMRLSCCIFLVNTSMYLNMFDGKWLVDIICFVKSNYVAQQSCRMYRSFLNGKIYRITLVNNSRHIQN